MCWHEARTTVSLLTVATPSFVRALAVARSFTSQFRWVRVTEYRRCHGLLCKAKPS
jgi:hypothetical protein